MTRDPQGARAEAGFTLIEVLLTMAIVAMLSAIVASALQIALLTWEKGEKRIEALERTRHLLDYITEDIRAAYAYRTGFDGQNLSAFFGDRKRVNFISSAPLISAGLPSTGLREVSYWVDGGKGLMLREAPLLHSELFDEDRGTMLAIAPAVREIRFEYLYQQYSRLTGQLDNIWNESWGAVSELSAATGITASLSFGDENARMRSLRALPSAVRVTLVVALDERGSETETLGPVTIPVMVQQLYEAKRQ
jgi:prepilin-type N-terminal cleavage/methylation domain-containing protein